MVVVSAVEEEDEDEVEEDAVELAYRQVERQVWIVPPALLLLPPLADLNLRMLDSIMNDDGCGGCGGCDDVSGGCGGCDDGSFGTLRTMRNVSTKI